VATKTITAPPSTAIVTPLMAKITGLYINPTSNSALSAQLSIANSTYSPWTVSGKGYVQLNSGTSIGAALPTSGLRRKLDGRKLLGGFVLDGDVDGNGYCGSEDIQAVNQLYQTRSFSSSSGGSSSLTNMRNAEPKLDYMTNSLCGSDYCGYGAFYSTAVVQASVTQADITYITQAYYNQQPFLQFPLSQTPCDLSNQVPTGSSLLWKLEATYYTPNTAGVSNGVPASCGSTNVYFQINYPSTGIVSVVQGGSIIASDATSSYIGPAYCLGGGVFTVSVTVASAQPYYTAAVAFTYSYSTLTSQYAHYGVIQSFSTNSFLPLYDSRRCPPQSNAPSLTPSSSSPISPSVQPICAPSLTPSSSRHSSPKQCCI